jgi:hypothetical protein
MTPEEFQKRLEEHRKKIEREGPMTPEELARRLGEMARKKKEEGEPRTS